MKVSKPKEITTLQSISLTLNIILYTDEDIDLSISTDGLQNHSTFLKNVRF